MVLLVGLCCSGSALSVHWRQHVANSCKKGRRLSRYGWGTRRRRSVRVLGHKMAQRSAPGRRRDPLHHLPSGPDPAELSRTSRSGRAWRLSAADDDCGSAAAAGDARRGGIRRQERAAPTLGGPSAESGLQPGPTGLALAPRNAAAAASQRPNSLNSLFGTELEALMKF